MRRSSRSGGISLALTAWTSNSLARTVGLAVRARLTASSSVRLATGACAVTGAAAPTSSREQVTTSLLTIDDPLGRAIRRACDWRSGGSGGSGVSERSARQGHAEPAPSAWARLRQDARACARTADASTLQQYHHHPHEAPNVPRTAEQRVF